MPRTPIPIIEEQSASIPVQGIRQIALTIAVGFLLLFVILGGMGFMLFSRIGDVRTDMTKGFAELEDKKLHALTTKALSENDNKKLQGLIQVQANVKDDLHDLNIKHKSFVDRFEASHVTKITSALAELKKSIDEQTTELEALQEDVENLQSALDAISKTLSPPSKQEKKSK
jgi:hypothetical protein